jgi:hypothetical protein
VRGRAGPSSLGGKQDLKFRALDDQTVQEGAKFSGMVLSKVNLEVGEAAPSFVYEEATWILRILVEFENPASRLVQSLGPRMPKGGFDGVSIRFLDHESG